jgi:hypothetical protein
LGGFWTTTTLELQSVPVHRCYAAFPIFFRNRDKDFGLRLPTLLSPLLTRFSVLWDSESRELVKQVEGISHGAPGEQHAAGAMADAQEEHGFPLHALAQAAAGEAREGDHGDGPEASAFAQRPVSG